MELVNYIRNFNPNDHDWNNMPNNLLSMNDKFLCPEEKGVLSAIRIAYTVEYTSNVIKHISNIYKGIRQILF